MTTFRDKVNILSAELYVTTTELSKACNLDGGYICKIKMGDRIPVKNGPTVEKISKGFAKIITEKEKEYMYDDYLTDGDTLEERLYNYFNEVAREEEKRGRRPKGMKKPRKKRKPYYYY